MPVTSSTEKVSVVARCRASGTTRYSARRWVSSTGSEVWGKRLITGEHPSLKVDGLTAASSDWRRSARSKGAIRKTTSTAAPIPAARTWSKPARSKNRNFSGKVKYSCSSRYPRKARRGYGSIPSCSPKPTGVSAVGGSTTGGFRLLGAASRIWIPVQLLHSTSYRLAATLLSPLRKKRRDESSILSKPTSGRQRSSSRMAAAASEERIGGLSRSGVTHCASVTLTGQSVVS